MSRDQRDLADWRTVAATGEQMGVDRAKPGAERTVRQSVCTVLRPNRDADLHPEAVHDGVCEEGCHFKFICPVCGYRWRVEEP